METVINFDHNTSRSAGEFIGVVSVVHVNPIIFEPKNNVFYTTHVVVDRISFIIYRKTCNCSKFEIGLGLLT
jgi:hypothetical protein